MRKIARELIFLFLFFLAYPYSYGRQIKLTVDNSPYYIPQRFVVKEADTLTAEPGVVIEMGKDASLIVEGKIDICGYPKGGEVIFKAARPYQNYHKGYWSGIIIKSPRKNRLNYVVVQHARTGIELEEGASAEIANNIITQNKSGLKAKGAKELIVRRNSFLGNFTDIELENTSAKIANNFFQGSLVGIKLDEAYPKIEGNYFKKVYKYALAADNEKELKLGKNWWGYGDKEEIKHLISQEGKGAIYFEPFLEKAPDLTEVGVDLKEK